MSQSHVRTEMQGAVATLVIDRPDKRNALDVATRQQLIEALGELRRNAAVRVVVITGSGKAFVSGADVGEFVGKNPVEILHDLRYGPGLIEVVDAFPKPVLAMINGYCLGSGNELAMACD
ncbi:MAG TPA: enoyl-CoA hydratase/isomerase family protein, partial [Gemmatimonadales bacterium]